MGGEEKVLHLSKEQVDSDTHLRDPVTGQDLEVIDKVRQRPHITRQPLGMAPHPVALPVRLEKLTCT